MAKFNFSRVWNAVKNFFVACVEIGWEVIKYILLAILVVVGVGCVYIPVTLIFCYNPVAFLLWMLICPGTAADGFYEYNRGKEACFGWYGRFIHWMLFWEVKLMPWYVKKHFVNEMPSDFSAGEMLRLFQEKLPEEKKGFFGDIVEIDNPALVKFFWDNCDTDDRKTLLSAKIDILLSYNKRSSVNLTKDDINFMLDNNMSELMDKYLKYRTPSAEIFKAMMDKVDDSIICDRLVANLIEREGLSSDLISWVYSVGSEKLKNVVEHALLVHGQKATVKKLCGFYCGTDAAEWKAFCEETPNICAEAQMEMNYHLMIKIFYETGHHMEESAIFYWLSVGKFVEYIFTNEPEFGLISPRIKALVNNDRELYREYVNAKSSSRK